MQRVIPFFNSDGEGSGKLPKTDSLGPTTERIQEENEREIARRKKKVEDLRTQRELVICIFQAVCQFFCEQLIILAQRGKNTSGD